MDRLKAKNLIIDKVRSLPTLPDMIHKVLTVIQNENTSARELGKLISYDQAISSRLLKVANSAYYGLMSEIATVQHAIVILGFKEVKSLVLGITVFDTIGKTDLGASIVHEEFWKHSIGSALAGQIISKNKAGTDEQTAFTASLLHDIGKLVLDRFFSQEYGKVLEKVRSNGTSMIEAEQEIMGFHHAEVGGWLCERWKFPKSLVSGIRFHHNIEKATAHDLPITSVVHLADVLCQRAGIGSSGDHKTPLIHPIAADHLKLHEDDFAVIVEELHHEEEKVASFLQAIQ